MKIYQLTRKQLIRARIDDVWAFFSNAGNLSAITPPYMNFKITSGKGQPGIYPGQVITYKISPVLHIPLSWMTEITHVVPKTLFVDEQRAGPYKIWHHEHHFEQQKDGVLMTDQLHYQLPLGILGNLAHALFVKRQLSDIFNYRQNKIEAIFNKLS